MITIDEALSSEWEYIGSGAANAVFAYCGTFEKLKHKVIRVRNLNGKLSTKEIYDYFHSPQFAHLNEYTVEPEIATITKNALEKLQIILNSEKPQFKLNLDEKDVLLMDNLFRFSMKDYKIIELSKYHKLFVHKFKSEILFEFKPKWLYTLPESHINCRNCLNARLKNQEFVCCHLKLLNPDSGIHEWCREIQGEISKRNELQLDLYDSIKNCIQKNYNLIQTLYSLQNNIDIHQRLLALNSENDVDEDLQFNMTIRDLSLFLNLNNQKIHIVDLDKKSRQKWESWKNQEVKLEKKYSLNLNLNCRVKTNI
jgi:hypothetical protein